MIKKVLKWVGIVFIALIVIGFIFGEDPSTEPTAAPANQPAAVSGSEPSSEPAKPAEPEVPSYKSGMYKVGADLPAGEYVLIGSGSAYFEITSDSTGTLESILANDMFSTRSIISVKDGQYVKLTSCTAYALEDAPEVELIDGFLPEGMYKVGVDLQAGEYKVVGQDSTSYVEVSNSSSHVLDNIISNDLFEGERYITIRDGQYIKLSGAKLKVE